MTKGSLKAIMAAEGSMRVLVGQLSTVGRDVRSTTMHWAYESKKLDCTVKHLSWVPPWVDALVEGQSPVGRCFLSDDQVVPDELGLGRHPSLWWTTICHYNAAYDVQRLNVKCEARAFLWMISTCGIGSNGARLRGTVLTLSLSS